VLKTTKIESIFGKSLKVQHYSMKVQRSGF
jgi:hypothetical protein